MAREHLAGGRSGALWSKALWRLAVASTLPPLDSQGGGPPEEVPGGDGVRIWISNLDNTAWGSKGTRPVAPKTGLDIALFKRG